MDPSNTLEVCIFFILHLRKERGEGEGEGEERERRERGEREDRRESVEREERERHLTHICQVIGSLLLCGAPLVVGSSTSAVALLP